MALYAQKHKFNCRMACVNSNVMIKITKKNHFCGLIHNDYNALHHGRSVTSLGNNVKMETSVLYQNSVFPFSFKIATIVFSNNSTPTVNGRMYEKSWVIHFSYNWDITCTQENKIKWCTVLVHLLYHSSRSWLIFYLHPICLEFLNLYF